MRLDPPICLIALGSNEISSWGDAKETVKTAFSALAKRFEARLGCSNMYSTPAYPVGAGPDYVNAVVAFPTELAAGDILATLHEIEAAAGRVRATRWGQRTLDLDLLGLGGQVLPDAATFCRWHDLPLDDQIAVAPDRLILPHPRLQDRAFVLVPLCDVAADWVHPVLGQTAQALCAALPASERAAVRPLSP